MKNKFLYILLLIIIVLLKLSQGEETKTTTHIHKVTSTKILKATETVKSSEASEVIESSQNSKADVPKYSTYAIIANDSTNENGTVIIEPAFLRTMYYIDTEQYISSSGNGSSINKNIALTIFVFGVLAVIAAIVYFVHKMRKEKQHYPYIQTF